jgi:hypothetical protein
VSKEQRRNHQAVLSLMKQFEERNPLMKSIKRFPEFMYFHESSSYKNDEVIHQVIFTINEDIDG